MAKPKTLLVPVDIWDGGILHDTDYHRGADSREEAKAINDELTARGPDSYGHDQGRKFGVSYVMEEVKPFVARLRVIRHERHRSATYVIVADEQGSAYPMFIPDLVDLLARAYVSDGLIEARRYEACKKGTAYGIRAANEES